MSFSFVSPKRVIKRCKPVLNGHTNEKNNNGLCEIARYW